MFTLKETEQAYDHETLPSALELNCECPHEF
jgi:hypothetical protein